MTKRTRQPESRHDVLRQRATDAVESLASAAKADPSMDLSEEALRVATCLFVLRVFYLKWAVDLGMTAPGFFDLSGACHGQNVAPRLMLAVDRFWGGDDIGRPRGGQLFNRGDSEAGRRNGLVAVAWIGDEEARAAFGPILEDSYAADETEALGYIHESTMDAKRRRGSGAHYTPRSLTEPIVRRTLEPILKALDDGVLEGKSRILDLHVCDPAVGGGAFPLEVVRQLGALVLARGEAPSLLVAKRLVALHCVYAVDVNPLSCEVAKFALWLECRASRMPLTWLDDQIKCGDALVGLSTEQLKAFHWKKSEDIRTKERLPPVDAALLGSVVDRALAAEIQRRHDRRSRLADLARVEEA